MTGGPADGADSVTEDLECLGAPADVVAAAGEAAKAGSVAMEILPANWRAVTLFVAAGSQWRFAGMDGVPTGLDYAGVEAAARMSGIEMSATLFARLRVMEGAALAAYGETRR